MLNPFAILGVRPGATREEIHQAYLAIAKATHPDRNPAPDARQRFIEAHHAYRLLLASASRRPSPITEMTPRPDATRSPAKPVDRVRPGLILQREQAALQAGVAPEGGKAVRPSLLGLTSGLLLPALAGLIGILLFNLAGSPQAPQSYLLGAFSFALLAAVLAVTRGRHLVRFLGAREVVWVCPAGLHVVSGQRIDSFTYEDLRAVEFGYDPLGRISFHPHYLELIIGPEARALRIARPYGESRLRRIVDLMLLESLRNPPASART